MQIAFQSPHAWADLNDQATESLGISAQSGMAMVVPGVGAALAELTAGLARQFPHRKKIFYFKSMDPALEEAAVHMSKEGFQVQPLDLGLLNQMTELKTLLDSNTLFVLASEDDPLMARSFDLTGLEELTEGKKIFLLKVSNHRFRYMSLPSVYTRNTYRVFRLASDLAIILTSSRIKWSPQFVNRLPIPSDALSRVVEVRSQRVAQESLVRQFEMQVPAKGKAVWDTSVPRVLDRAVVFWGDLDGWAVVSMVASRMGLQIPPLGQASLLETTSLNRWKAVRTMDWLYGLGFNPTMIRGTVIMDQELLSRRELIPSLETVCSEIRKIQSGN